MRHAKSTTERRTLYYPRGIFHPEDLIDFIQLRPFAREWKRHGLSDNDLRELETVLMADPLIGELVRGAGGLRKVRFAPDHWNMGKRGALRVCYGYFADIFKIVLAQVYRKNRKEDLTEAEKVAMRKTLPIIHEGFTRERKRKDA